jgi:hypothetical protein
MGKNNKGAILTITERKQGILFAVIYLVVKMLNRVPKLLLKSFCLSKNMFIP